MSSRDYPILCSVTLLRFFLEPAGDGPPPPGGVDTGGGGGMDTGGRGGRYIIVLQIPGDQAVSQRPGHRTPPSPHQGLVLLIPDPPHPHRHCSSMHYTIAIRNILHALHNCAFYARVHCFMVVCFGEWRIQGKSGRWMHFPIVHSLNTTPRAVLLAAQRAHWATRCVTSAP